MERRRFILVASQVLALPAVMGGDLVAAGPAAFRPASARLYFDERFPAAHHHAAAIARSIGIDPVAVHGDVSPYWTSDLNRTARSHPLELHGVTTESFRFCLDILLRERSSVRGQVSRLDGNLLLWSIRSHPRGIQESFHG